MKVLLATDGSEYSGEAARFLARFNFSPDDEITVLHALRWTPVLTEWEVFYDNLQEIQDEVAPRILESTADILRPLKAKIVKSFKEEYADKAIVQEASESGADLIVMGARGLRGLASVIVGSVTKLVAIRSTVPVLIVKPSRSEAAALKVLFATDGSDHAAAAADMLASLPFPDNTEFLVLHVVTTAFEDIPERFALEINERIKNIVAGTREKELKKSEEILAASLEPLRGKSATIEKQVKYGDPSTAIVETADEVRADIIAMGTSGMRGIKGMMGSVSRYVLNHAQCSVLITRT